MKRSELLEDYCQKCGNTLGSLDCCRVKKTAIITFKSKTYGCQKHHNEDRLINWVSGSIDEKIEITFEPSDKYTDDVMVMKAFQRWIIKKLEMKQIIGNTAEFLYPTGVEIKG